jgi:ribosomal protein S18 acetylase RimI-like enzyme
LKKIGTTSRMATNGFIKGDGKMSKELIRCEAQDLFALQELSIETFKETFAAQNQAENLNDYLKRAFTLEKLEAELNDPESFFYFLKKDSQTAGYLKLNIGAAQSEEQGTDALEIERIYLKKAYQRMGLGEYLIKESEEKAKQLQKKRVWLGVWEENSPARSFYEKMGYHAFSAHTFMMGTDKQTDILLEKKIRGAI